MAAIALLQILITACGIINLKQKESKILIPVLSSIFF